MSFFLFFPFFLTIIRGFGIFLNICFLQSNLNSIEVVTCENLSPFDSIYSAVLWLYTVKLRGKGANSKHTVNRAQKTVILALNAFFNRNWKPIERLAFVPNCRIGEYPSKVKFY